MTTPETMKGSRLRLIMLTQWFEPEPALKGIKFAQRLGKFGFDVEVVTGFPNYPGGTVYDGYRVRPIRRESMDGVSVTRLALFPSHSRNRIGRTFNYMSFFIAATIYLTFFVRRADVAYVYHPPLTVAVAALVAKFFRRTPIVLDVQDMWPDTLRATGMLDSKGALKIIDVISRWAWRSANHVTVLSPGFQKLLVERGVPQERISIIPNWADDDEAGSDAEIAGPVKDRVGQKKFCVLFAGNMGPAQALDTVLDAAAILRSAWPQIEFRFLGSGIDADRLKGRVETENLTNVQFLARVPKAEVRAYIQAADCLLVHLKADPLFTITIPSKTQAYMAGGKPVVMAVEGDAADLVRQSAGGVVVPPEDAQALARAISELAGLAPAALAELGANARRFYDAHLSFDLGARRFADVLASAGGGGRR